MRVAVFNHVCETRGPKHVNEYRVMAEIVVDDAADNLLEAANLKPPKHGTSAVWRYFGFRHDGGVITDNTRVSRLFFIFYLFVFAYLFIVSNRTHISTMFFHYSGCLCCWWMPCDIEILWQHN